MAGAYQVDETAPALIPALNRYPLAPDLTVTRSCERGQICPVLVQVFKSARSVAHDLSARISLDPNDDIVPLFWPLSARKASSKRT